MLATLSVAWAVLQFGRFLLSPLLPTIIADLHITNAAAGIALTLFQGIYAVMQYPSGEYSDRWSRATLLVPGFAVLAGGFALLGATHTYLAFVAATVVVGLGKGLFSIPSRALISDLYVERRGRALGIYAAGTDLGGLAASGLAVVVLAYASWQVPFLPVAAALAVLALCFVRWSGEPYRVTDPSLDVVGTVKRLLVTPEQRETLAAFSLFYFMVGGFINFFPTYLAYSKGFSESLASATFALVFVVGLGIKPLVGGLSDRVHRRTLAAGGFALAAGALCALLVADSRLLIGASVVALALGYKMEFPLADAIIVDGAAAEDVGADLGAARALFLGVGALGPAYVGVVSTYASYAVAFGGLAACLLVGGALLVRRRE